jgi:hypothetical protein
VGVQSGSDGTREEGLSGSRWSVKQHTVWGFDIYLSEKFGIHEGKLDDSLGARGPIHLETSVRDDRCMTSDLEL